MAHVPALTGTDRKTGDTYAYGDYDVQLVECAICHGVYADASEHAGTGRHKAAVIAAA